MTTKQNQNKMAKWRRTDSKCWLSWVKKSCRNLQCFIRLIRNSMTSSGNFGKIDPRFILTFFEIALTSFGQFQKTSKWTSGYFSQIALKVILLLTQINLCSFVRPFVRPFVTSFSQDWLIGIFWVFAQRCKMVKLKMWRSPIFKKKKFLGQFRALKCPKIGFFRLCEKSVH